MPVQTKAVPVQATPDALSFETLADRVLQTVRDGIDRKRSRRAAQDLEEVIDHACLVLTDEATLSPYRWAVRGRPPSETPAPDVRRMVIGSTVKRHIENERSQELADALKAAQAMRKQQYQESQERRAMVASPV